MNIDGHRGKALRIERSLAKCRSADYEIRIEAAMLAATHWVNLAYHRMQATAADQDVMHSYMLTVNEFRRLAAANERLISMLSEIEDLRPVFVRGDAAGGIGIADRAIALLAEIKAIALQPAGTIAAP